ncbi:MAG: shikimate dehydrogenase [Rhodoferax sp.]|uniref:shikimate dehydrogenase family protein n=1 Tax=Rhodoferax sp. TaxID=50421 RepID=UPI001B4455F8|nr:shikimate dehydrogenase [Rhodoferax sp.]MBP9904805.1 shikimate dehydrogenase [Rhodoferax sp.]
MSPKDSQVASIQGTTRLYPVIGYPVAQVKAPLLYNPLFAASGIDAVVVPLEVPPAMYPEVFKSLFKVNNLHGAMVTIPHKVTTVALLDDCSDAVRIAGACNAVVRRVDGSLYGDLFDGVGFVHALRHHDFEVAGSSCLVVGAGGAGAAIAAALAGAGAGRVRLHDAHAGQAESVVSHLRQYFPKISIEAGPAELAGFALVVNATPLGMELDDPLPVDVSQITAEMLIAEIVMKREITPLVAAARARGCKTVLGREMLDAQLPLYLDFFGLNPQTHSQPLN